MRRFTLAAALLAALTLAPPLPRATAQQEPAPPPTPAQPNVAPQHLASLSWLAGTWRGDSDGGVFETTYTSPDGGQILSVSKSITGGKVDFYEFERIEAQEGAVVLSPYPMGDAAATFRLGTYDPTVKKAVFSNPQNDFPSELTFELTAPDALRITIAGMQDGQHTVLKLELKKR